LGYVYFYAKELEMKFEDAVGKWCLIRAKGDWFGKPRQAKIIELSPSGKYVRYKIMHDSHSVWGNVGSIDILEILYDA